MARFAKFLGAAFDSGYLGGFLFVLGAVIAIPYDDETARFDIGGWVALAGIFVFGASRTSTGSGDGGVYSDGGDD